MTYRVIIRFAFDYEGVHYDASSDAQLEMDPRLHMLYHGFGDDYEESQAEPTAASLNFSMGAIKFMETEGITAEQLEDIEGTGKDGAILKADVMEYLEL